MSKKGKIVFWILFPLLTLIVSFIFIFLLDLANGAFFLLILEIIAIVLFVIYRIILRNRRFIYRLIPTVAFIVSSVLIVSLASPIIRNPAIFEHTQVEEIEITLKNGKGKGLLNVKENVEGYAGVPYAEAPIGDLRWKEPKPKENWEGVKDFTKFAPKSMQSKSNQMMNSLVDVYSSKGWYPNFKQGEEQEMSEDSLYLNIWKPHTNETNLPILMFIHGGSLSTGSSAYSDYNGMELAKRGIIVITITYRLNIFGYFAHEELINESENHTTGNYGLLDQIEALKWINANAEYFGGDKNNITVAGESAGSSSVSAICVSPLAKGLFKRAIGESSSIVSKVAPHTYRTMENALEVGNNILKEFKCKDINELRKIDASKLVNTKYANSSMTLDGYAITKTPHEVYIDGENNEEALLNGYNVKEADAFVIPTYLFSPTNKNNIKERLISTFNEEIGTAIYDLYKDKIEKDAFSAFNEIISVYWFMEPHYTWSNIAKENNVTVYRYQFTKTNGYHGNYHAGELIYAYGNVKHAKNQVFYNQSDRDLSNIMSSYWLNFVKTGNPNGEGLPKWDEFLMGDKMIMELGDNVSMINEKYLDLYPLIISYQESLLANQ